MMRLSMRSILNNGCFKLPNIQISRVYSNEAEPYTLKSLAHLYHQIQSEKRFSSSLPLSQKLCKMAVQMEKTPDVAAYAILATFWSSRDWSHSEIWSFLQETKWDHSTNLNNLMSNDREQLRYFHSICLPFPMWAYESLVCTMLAFPKRQEQKTHEYILESLKRLDEAKYNISIWTLYHSAMHLNQYFCRKAWNMKRLISLDERQRIIWCLRKMVSCLEKTPLSVPYCITLMNAVFSHLTQMLQGTNKRQLEARHLEWIRDYLSFMTIEYLSFSRLEPVNVPVVHCEVAKSIASIISRLPLKDVNARSILTRLMSCEPKLLSYNGAYSAMSAFVMDRCMDRKAYHLASNYLSQVHGDEAIDNHLEQVRVHALISRARSRSNMSSLKLLEEMLITFTDSGKKSLEREMRLVVGFLQGILDEVHNEPIRKEIFDRLQEMFIATFHCLPKAVSEDDFNRFEKVFADLKQNLGLDKLIAHVTLYLMTRFNPPHLLVGVVLSQLFKKVKSNATLCFPDSKSLNQLLDLMKCYAYRTSVDDSSARYRIMDSMLQLGTLLRNRLQSSERDLVETSLLSVIAAESTMDRVNVLSSERNDEFIHGGIVRWTPFALESDEAQAGAILRPKLCEKLMKWITKFENISFDESPVFNETNRISPLHSPNLTLDAFEQPDRVHGP